MSDAKHVLDASYALRTTVSLAVGAGVDPLILAGFCLIQAIELYRSAGMQPAAIDSHISEMLVTHHGA